MSRLTRILLLATCFFPVLIAQVLAFSLLSGPVDGSSWLEAHIAYLIFSLVACQLAIAAFFIWHLRNRSRIPREQHLSWVLKFFFVPFGVVGYWYQHVWRADGHSL